MLHTLDMPPLKLHPLAEAFPPMTKDELRALLEDVSAHGLIEPITLFEGQILDGRHRYMVCAQLRRPIECVEYAGDNPLQFVVSKNEKRRHLTPSQLAIVAAKLSTGLARGTNQFKSKGKMDSSTELSSQETIAKTLGVGVATLKRAVRVVEEATPETIKAVASGELTVRAAEREIVNRAREINARNNTLRREQRMEEIQSRVKDPGPLDANATYSVLLIDPPWKFQAGYSSRSVENHYPLMAQSELMALPVEKLANPDAVLFLWATIPFLADALELMAAWGFEYKSHIAWVKSKIGLGFWVRAKHELLLVGTRGGIPAPAQGTQPPSVIEAPAGKHSEKPAIFASTIENLYPRLPRIELFCRTPRKGWTAWGNEAP